MNTDGEKDAKRMRKDEVLSGDSKSEEVKDSAGGSYARDEDVEMNDSIKRKKKQSEDTEQEHHAKRQNVNDEPNREKMEVDINEMDLIDEPDVWEKLDQYEAEEEYCEQGEFDAKILEVARKEEISFMMKLGVWVDASLEECMARTG